MYYDKKASDLISDILNVSLLLLVIGLIFLIFKNGFNKLFIKTKTKLNIAKNNINDRLTKENLKYTLNENLFEFLTKIKEFLEQPNFFVLVISTFLFILWFYILYIMTQSYFYDSEVLYKDNDEYNVKHLFDSIYSNYDKEVWVNSDSNNYISESGKLCKLNPNIFNSCLIEMNSYANENIFDIDYPITPDFVKATKEILFKKYDNSGNIFMRKCELTFSSESNYTDCSYIPVIIEKVLYNTRKIQINKAIEDTQTDDKVIFFDDPRIIFPLENGYYFDIKYSELEKLFEQKHISYFEILKNNNKFNVEEDTYIKCKVININTNENGFIKKNFKLKVYNPDDDMKGTKYESFNIQGISGEHYMGNENTCRPQDISSSIINKFNTISYLGENMKLIFDQEKEKQKNEERDIDLSNILEDDLSEKLQLKLHDKCIVYKDYDDLIKGDIVKIIDDNRFREKATLTEDEKENLKFKNYNTFKYDIISKKYIKTPINIGRNYLLCDDSEKNAIFVNDLFSNKCKLQQENSVLEHNSNNDFYNYGCK